MEPTKKNKAFKLLAQLGLSFAICILSLNANSKVLYHKKACVDESCLSEVKLIKKADHYKLYFEGGFPLFEDLNLLQFHFIGEALKLIPKGKNFEVSLNSGGGTNIVAQIINEKIKRKCFVNDVKICKITTTVERQNECSSYCMLIYMIGDYREAHETARFGFHTSFPVDLKWTEELKDDLALNMAHTLHTSGVDPQFLNWSLHRGILQQPKVSYLLPRDLRAIPSNILTEQR